LTIQKEYAKLYLFTFQRSSLCHRLQNKTCYCDPRASADLH